jgi:hypothetical protein
MDKMSKIKLNKVYIGTIVTLLLTWACSVPASLAVPATEEAYDCSYTLPPEESLLTPEIFINLNEGESFEKIFGVTTTLHAECHEGKLGYYIARPNPDCIIETVKITPDGGWSCFEPLGDGTYMWTSEISFGWTWPNGKPATWQEPEMEIPFPADPNTQGT